MTRLLSLLLFAVALFMSGWARAFSLPELAERTKPSVVLLEISDASGRKLGSGTGFFVSSSGRIVTNYHVVEHGERVSGTLSDGRKIEIVGALGWDRERDLAVLQAEPGDYPALPLGDSAKVRPGDEVFVIGSPLGLSGTISSGIVSALRDEGIGDIDAVGPKPQLAGWGIQITAAISPGSSGSPVMTKEGEVIGIAVGARTDGQALNFAVPSAAAKSLLDGMSADARPQSLPSLQAQSTGGGGTWRNLAISGGVFGGIAVVWLIVSKLLAMRARRSRSPKRAS